MIEPHGYTKDRPDVRAIIREDRFLKRLEKKMPSQLVDATPSSTSQERKMTTSLPRVSMSLQNITPQLAQEYLRTSTVNRPISPYIVLSYKIQMMKGLWFPWPPIEFDDEGHLMNGHHRLHAIIAAGITVSIHVVRGVAVEIREIIDTHGKKSLPQQLKMYRPNLKNGATLASYVSVCSYLLTGVKIRLTTVKDFEQWHSIFKKGLDWSARVIIPSKLCRPGPIGGALAFAHLTDPKKVEEFGQSLVDGEGLEKGSPIYVLRKLMENTHPGARVGAYRDSMARKVMNAIRAYVYDETIKKIPSHDAGRRHFSEAYDNMRRAKALSAPWIEQFVLVKEPEEGSQIVMPGSNLP